MGKDLDYPKSEQNSADHVEHTDHFVAALTDIVKTCQVFPEHGGGLALVATPIGNRSDITLRALYALSQADIVACEDTRRTGMLLKNYGLRAERFCSLFEHNEVRQIPKLISEIQAGKQVTVVSNAGLPAVSDPGYKLLRACIAENLAVTVVPGASAVLTALLLSGFSTASFTFHGFLPRRSGRRQASLQAAAKQTETQIFFESPKRLVAFLKEILTIFGNRLVAVCREMTKVHEETLRAPVMQLIDILEKRPAIRGEIVVVVSGVSDSEDTESDRDE